MKVVKGVITGVLAATIVFPAPNLLAQFGGGMPKGGERMRGSGGPPAGGFPREQRPSSQDNIVELVEFRLLSFEEDLKLTPIQEKIFASYADKVRALAADNVRERARSRAQPGTPLNAMQQMNRAVDSARNRLTALEEISASAKTLYEGLAPEQKMLADSRFAAIIPVIASSAPAGSPPEPMGRTRPQQDGSFGPPRRDRDSGGPR